MPVDILTTGDAIDVIVTRASSGWSTLTILLIISAIILLYKIFTNRGDK